MNHSDQGKRGRVGTSLEERRVGEVIRKETAFLHLEESVEGERRV